MRLDHHLRIATRAYYWKPAMAWFRALELDAYRSARVVLQGPVLDVGCGDGRMAGMLCQMGILRGPVFGVDPSERQISQARRARFHEGLIRADGGQLPFGDGSFASALCNGSLSSIPDGPDAALREVRRILEPAGLFIATFPTDRFLDVLLAPRLIGFWPAARRSYERRMTLRQPHFTADSPADWTRRFAGAGFEIKYASTFFSSRAGAIWNLLSMHILRVVGLTRLAPGTTRSAVAVLNCSLGGAYMAERAREGSGYMLVIAHPMRNDDSPGAAR